MHDPTLDAVIATSPARSTGRVVHVFQLDAPVQPEPEDLAVISDGIETTVVTSSATRVATARSRNQSIEGPFSVIRLEISLSFGAPGFIAAATTACAGAGINAFMLSTFSFDYLLVPTSDEPAALTALSKAGFPIAPPQE